MDALRHDLRYALRTLRANPGFTLVAILSLALGIGANTAIFSIYTSIFRRGLPVADPDRLVEVYTFEPGSDIGLEFAPSSYADFVDLREQSSDVFADVVLYNITLLIMDQGDVSEYLFGEKVSSGYFGMLGVEPALGRSFDPVTEEVTGTPPAVMVSYALWQSRFGADPGIIGRTVQLSGHDFTIIGVAPEKFRGLFPIPSDFWYPITLDPLIHPGTSVLTRRGERENWVKARLRTGVEIEEARAACAVVSARLAAEYPETNTGHEVRLIPSTKVSLHPQLDNIILAFTVFLMGMVGLVLLIACANLASMLLARALSRRREIGIRLAMGAGRYRLIRQLLTESILLALLGGAAGVALAAWLIRILLAVQPPLPVPINLEIGLDAGVLGFAFLLSLVTGIVFGLLPAWQTTRPQLMHSLRDAYDTPAGRLGRFGLRSSLVIAQVAVSALLLIAAGLFLRSLANTGRADIGFDLRRGVVVTLETFERGYSTEEGTTFFRQLLDRLNALPGVESVAMTSRMPLGSSISTTTIYPETHAREIGADGVEIDVATVGPNYFATMGIPILTGRAFTEGEGEAGEGAVIVNETFARIYWPGESALGHTVRLAGPEEPPNRIVGIAKDGKYRSLGEVPRAFLYRAGSTNRMLFGHLIVRSSIDGRELLQPVREAIRETDRRMPIMSLVTVPQHLELMLFLPRLLAGLLTGLGLLSLILGTTGLYGVIAYDVSRRTREVGVRMALGARQSQVVGLVIRDGLKLVIAGTAAGLLLALLASGALESMLIGVVPTDPVTYGVVAGLFLGVGITATWRPARRATAVDPVEALRSE